MSAKKLMILVGILVVVLLVYFIFKDNYSSPTYVNQPSITSVTSTSGENVTTTSGEAQSQIEIKNFSFNPSSVTVKTGTTVTWVNNDSVPHDITNDPDGSKFKSQTLQQGENFKFTFDTAGTFPYYCGIHPSMQGTVIVEP